MTCQQKGCKDDAEYTVYWPNQVTKQCSFHAMLLKNLGIAMGINVPLVSLKEKKDK